MQNLQRLLKQKQLKKRYENVEMVGLGRGSDNKGVYYVVMAKPENADRDIEIRIYDKK